jgi:hypothetical protein
MPPMRLPRALLTLLVASACTKSPPPPAPRAPDDPCLHIQRLAQVMDCELAPFQTGSSGDEAAFRRALTQLKELAPSDPAFHGSPSWPELVEQMLGTRDYNRGCTACHQSYLPLYRRSYSAVEIPWTDVRSR